MKPSAVLLATVTTIIVATVPATAHVAPAKDRNNQYIKVTPMRDGIRLAYTIYIGDGPARQARQRMDRDRNGLLDDKEKGLYGDATATAVGAGITVEIDGDAVPLSWSLVHVGLGVAQTDARWFAIDMVAWLCVPDAGRTDHTMRLRNRFKIPKPGETELRVEESPGVTIARSSIAGGAANQLAFRWKGGAIALAHDPYELSFKIDPAVAPRTPDDACGGSQQRQSAPVRRTSARVTALIVAGVGGLFIVGLWLVIRKRRRRTS